MHIIAITMIAGKTRDISLVPRPSSLAIYLRKLHFRGGRKKGIRIRGRKDLIAAWALSLEGGARPPSNEP